MALEKTHDKSKENSSSSDIQQKPPRVHPFGIPPDPNRPSEAGAAREAVSNDQRDAANSASQLNSSEIGNKARQQRSTF